MKALLPLLIFSTLTCSAGTIFEAPGVLGDLARRIKVNWGSSSKASGIQKAFTKEDCIKKIKKQIKNSTSESEKVFAGYSRKFTESDILSDEVIDTESKRSGLLIGLSPNYWGQGLGYSPEDATHLNRNCKEFMSLSKIENIEINGKICRISQLNLDQYSYDIKFCVGESSGKVIHYN